MQAGDNDSKSPPAAPTSQPQPPTDSSPQQQQQQQQSSDAALAAPPPRNDQSVVYTDEKTAFVKGLHPDVQQSDLEGAFESCGDLRSVRMMFDKFTGRSRVSGVHLSSLRPCSVLFGFACAVMLQAADFAAMCGEEWQAVGPVIWIWSWHAAILCQYRALLLLVVLSCLS